MKNLGNVLVVGGGIAGIQASLDLADRGFNVYLVEKTPSIGGRMVQLDKTFPTMDCSICILAPKMIDVNRRQNISLLTYSEVKDVRGRPGKFSVKVLRKSRFVDEEKCTGCGTCITNCPVNYRIYPESKSKVEIKLGAKEQKKIEGIIEKYRDVEFANIKVDSIKLKKSDLTQKGPIYTTLKEIKL